MTCHYVHSVPFTARLAGCRFERKVRRTLHDKGMAIGLLSNRKPSKQDFSDWPVRYPFEHTRNLYLALCEKTPTILYHLTEHVHCRFRPDDVFLGHPFFPHSETGFGVTELAANEKVRPRKFALITPLHCDVAIITSHINKAFLDDVDRLLPSADILFAIMGEYWWNRWDSSPYSHWKPKMIRLDLAVDVSRFPRVKHRFNQPGRRGYLYIGASDLRKGSDFLGRLMERVGDYPKGWIGHGPEIPNVQRISPDRPLTPDFISRIAEEYDFFISPSRADPNPTTILESMAWGFPVVCTPQSGYYETTYRPNIYLDDVNRSLAVLERLQFAADDELTYMADEARRVVETVYTWQKFTSTVIQNLGL